MRKQWRTSPLKKSRSWSSPLSRKPRPDCFTIISTINAIVLARKELSDHCLSVEGEGAIRWKECKGERKTKDLWKFRRDLWDVGATVVGKENIIYFIISKQAVIYEAGCCFVFLLQGDASHRWNLLFYIRILLSCCFYTLYYCSLPLIKSDI